MLCLVNSLVLKLFILLIHLLRLNKGIVMDKEYWEHYYKVVRKSMSERKPSNFAIFCRDNYFSEKCVVVDLGAGDGRDSLYFAEYGHHVYALDQCDSIRDLEGSKIGQGIKGKISPIATDFINFDYNLLPSVDVFYSRFTLHAVKLPEEDIILNKVYSRLGSGGRLCIEARTTKDDLFGRGQYVCDTTYKTDHCRRFIDAQSFIRKLQDLGFELQFFHEEKGFSRQGDNDPCLLRVVVQRV